MRVPAARGQALRQPDSFSLIGQCGMCVLQLYIHVSCDANLISSCLCSTMANTRFDMPVAITETGEVGDTPGQGQDVLHNFGNYFEDGNVEFETDWNILDISFGSNVEAGDPKGQDEFNIIEEFEEFYDVGNQFSSPHDEDSILEDLGNMKIETADIDEVYSSKFQFCVHLL